jgi:hypothetical protein
VHDITADWYPFIKSSPLKKRVGSENGGKDAHSGYIVNPIEENPDDAAERLQDFYLSLEQDMRAGGTPFIPRRKEKESEMDVEDERDREKREHDRMESETRIREVMEAVECTITSLFYDRYENCSLLHQGSIADPISDYSCKRQPTMHPMTKHFQAESLHSTCWIWVLVILV